MDKTIHEQILSSKSIAISGHVKPDGDCMGSSMGLYHYISNKYPEIQVDVYLEAIPPAFVFMKDSEKIKLELEDNATYDLFFALDCGDTGRLGKFSRLLDVSKKSICIDHHVSNKGFADYSYIEPEMSSTSELVYSLIDTEYVDVKAAECLYTGIVHDTGVFQYSSTTSLTMKRAGELMDKGIDYPRIVDESYYMKYVVQNRLMGYCLLNCELKLDGKVILSVLPKKVIEEFGGVASDLEGIVAQLRQTKDVEVAIFAYELEDGLYKLSLRACNYVDVAQIASEFGGGGHVRAAGCSVTENINSVIDKVLSMIKAQL